MNKLHECITFTVGLMLRHQKHATSHPSNYEYDDSDLAAVAIGFQDGSIRIGGDEIGVSFACDMV